MVRAGAHTIPELDPDPEALHTLGVADIALKRYVGKQSALIHSDMLILYPVNECAPSIRILPGTVQFQDWVLSKAIMNPSFGT